MASAASVSSPDETHHSYLELNATKALIRISRHEDTWFDGELMQPSLLSVTLAGFGEAMSSQRSTGRRSKMSGWVYSDTTTGRGTSMATGTTSPRRARFHYALNFLTGVVLFAPNTGTDVGATSECALAVDPTDGLRHPSPRGGQDRAHVHRRGAVLIARESRGIQCLRAPRVARYSRRPRPRTIGVGQRSSDIGSSAGHSVRGIATIDVGTRRLGM